MKLLLDTNICIYLIRQKLPHLLARFTMYDAGDIGVSAITAAELHFGVQKSCRPEQNRQALEQFLLPLVIVDWDYEAAVVYGRLRGVLEAQGNSIGALDLLIAAQAIRLGLVLVTNNTREFSRVPGLTLADWVHP